MAQSTVDIFRYSDHRAYLRDALDALRNGSGHGSGSRGFSYRRFARRAGLKAHTLVKLVIDGQRNITVPTAQGFARALGLNRQASDFFVSMVAFGQARSEDERSRAFAEMARHRSFRAASPAESTAYACYAQWYCIALRELVALPDFREDPEWIARILEPQITAAQAQRAIALLLEHGWLVRDADGKLRQAESTIAVQGAMLPTVVHRFHQQALGLAQRALDQLARRRREVGGVTLRLSRLQYETLVERLDAVADEVLAMESVADGATVVEGEDEHEVAGGTDCEVYHFAFQLFPMTNAQRVRTKGLAAQDSVTRIGHNQFEKGASAVASMDDHSGDERIPQDGPSGSDNPSGFKAG